MKASGIIRKAVNNDGDSVLFWRSETGAEIRYQVVLCNSRTEHTLKAYSTAIAVEAFGRKHLERAAQVKSMEVFREACQFMGIEVPGEDE